MPSAFLDEVAEQPDALRSLVAFYRGEGAGRLRRWAEVAGEAGRVVFAGMGTSEFTPELVLASLASAGVDASTLDAGELLHYPRPTRGVRVLISQSGESAETRRLAEEMARETGPVAVTNDEQSTLARLAQLVLPLRAGHETAITNKTYVNTLALLHLMAQAMHGPEGMAQGLHSLARLADAMPDYDADGIERAADRLAGAACLHFVARGPALAAAKQAALTFMEGTRISATALTGGAFRHGPFELVGPTNCTVFFMPGGATTNLLEGIAREAAEKGSTVVAITDRQPSLPDDSCTVLRVPAFGEGLFPLAAATTQELLMEAVARRRGVVAGEFRYGQKITRHE